MVERLSQLSVFLGVLSSEFVGKRHALRETQSDLCWFNSHLATFDCDSVPSSAEALSLVQDALNNI